MFNLKNIKTWHIILAIILWFTNNVIISLFEDNLKLGAEKIYSNPLFIEYTVPFLIAIVPLIIFLLIIYMVAATTIDKKETKKQQQEKDVFQENDIEIHEQPLGMHEQPLGMHEQPLGMHEQLLGEDGKLDNKELYRLKVQGNRNYKQDVSVIKKSLSKIDRYKNLSLLDVGCGDGSVTLSVFDNFPEISQVMGIDKNIEAINKAIANKKNEKYDFRVFDIEDISMNYIGNLSSRKDNKYDIIFCSLVLPHIENPFQLIKKLTEVLSPGGVIIFRSSDDGTKICHPESDNLQKILDYTSEIPGVSDRYNARKMLSLLTRAGFTEIESSYDVLDTVSKTKEERSLIFHKSFSFRRNYLNKTLLKGVKTNFIKEDFDKSLKILEDNFTDSDFYYMEISYCFIAKLPN